MSFAAFVIFAFATEFVNSGFNFINIGKLFLSLVILFSGIENQINLLKTNHEKLIKNLKDKIYLGLSIIYITFLTLNIVSQHSFSLMYIHNKDDFNKDDYKFVNSLSILETNEKMQYLFHFKNLGNNNGFFLVTNKKVLTQDHLQKVDKLNFNDLEKIEKEIISEDVSKLNLILKSGESINITIPRKRKRDEEVYFYIYNELKTLSNGA
ncbi:hypothetical protein CH366_19375 [Leptospira harrisiae]|nr:hypothetical protein CH366_19375 [Leptospira harrisiae]